MYTDIAVSPAMKLSQDNYGSPFPVFPETVNAFICFKFEDLIIASLQTALRFAESVIVADSLSIQTFF